MLRQQLQERLGLELTEVTIYLALNNKKSLSIVEMSDRTRLSIHKIKSGTTNLLRKGLIIEAVGPKNTFTALHPKLALTNVFNTFQEEQVSKIREKRRSVEGLVSALTPIYEKTRESTAAPKLQTSLGEQGFWVKMLELIEDSKKVHSFATTLPVPPSRIMQAYEDALSRNLKIHLVLPVPNRLYSEQAEFLTNLVHRGLNLRSWKEPPLTFCVFDDLYVGLPLVSDDHIDNPGIWARDDDLAKHFTKHFSSIWAKSTRDVKINIRYGS